MTLLNILIGFSYYQWTTLLHQFQDHTQLSSDVKELPFKIWISEEIVRDHRKLVANLFIPGDASAQFSLVTSRQLMYMYVRRA